jgi:hypothetical protein
MMFPCHRSFRSRILALSIPFALVACGGGGDDGPGVEARVPSGSGRVTIQMAGTWEVRDASVVDSNDPAPALPLNGTQVVIGPNSVLSIAGFSTAQPDLEAFLGFPLSFYFNQADGRTVVYAAHIDRVTQGGGREEVGVAGGSVDDNTISVEQWNSRRANSTSPELFTRSRYLLARVANSYLQPDAVEAVPAEQALRNQLDDALHGLFGR